MGLLLAPAEGFGQYDVRRVPDAVSKFKIVSGRRQESVIWCQEVVICCQEGIKWCHKGVIWV